MLGDVVAVGHGRVPSPSTGELVVNVPVGWPVELDERAASASGADDVAEEDQAVDPGADGAGTARRPAP